MDSQKPVRTRFAPSPTGRMHLGSGRTALFDYLLSRQTGGKFILRLEDTDVKRFVPGSEEELMHGLHWLGIDWDEGIGVGGLHGPYRQSERKETYQKYARELIKNGHAYYCFCTPERLERVRQEQMKNKGSLHYDRTCRNLSPEETAERVARGESHVVRFKMPLEGTITCYDRLRGAITVENRNLDDYILVKSDGLALYHLAAMVDDHLMEVTHVIRGSEWLSTFPLHVHIIRAFDWPEPEWIHLSIFLKPSGKGKMSKRETAQWMQDGHSIFIGDLEALGYLPEAVVNWIALMGWSYDDHTEFFTLEDLVEKFSLDHLNPAPAAINFSKLDHFNGMHIRALPVPELARRLQPYFKTAGYDLDLAQIEKFTPLIRERMVTLDEGPEVAGFLLQDNLEFDPEELVGKKMRPDESAEAARRAYHILDALPEIGPKTAEEPLRALAEEMGLKPGQLFGILRVAITGRSISPPLLESMAILGKQKSLDRLQKAIQTLEAL
ncbi:MAG TPA: glutamate--tRNA ligase [Anaerolineales bacterium]